MKQQHILAVLAQHHDGLSADDILRQLGIEAPTRAERAAVVHALRALKRAGQVKQTYAPDRGWLSRASGLAKPAGRQRKLRPPQFGDREKDGGIQLIVGWSRTRGN